MGDQIEQRRPKEMKNKAKFKCTQLRTMAYRVECLSMWKETAFLCNADTYIATGMYPPFFWFCDKNQIPAD